MVTSDGKPVSHWPIDLLSDGKEQAVFVAQLRTGDAGRVSTAVEYGDYLLRSYGCPPLLVAVDEAVVEAVLSMRPGPRITGYVRDPSGSTVAQASIYACAGYNGLGAALVSRSRADGSYFIPAVESHTMLFADKAGYVPGAPELVSASPAMGHAYAIDLTVKEGSAVVALNCPGATGQAMVYARPRDQQGEVGWRPPRRFMIDDVESDTVEVEPGFYDWVVVVTGDVYAKAAGVVLGPNRVEFGSSGQAVVVRAVSEDGDPVQGARVAWVIGEHRRTTKSMTDEFGQVRLMLPSSVDAVQVATEDAYGVVDNPGVSAGSDGVVPIVEVLVRKRPAIRCILLREDGVPLAGQSLILVGLDGSHRAAAVTNDTGEAVFPRVGSGVFRIARVVGGDYRVLSTQVKPSSDAYVLTCDDPPRGVVNVELTTTDLPQVAYGYFRHASGVERAVRGARIDRGYTFVGVAQGEYRLRVGALAWEADCGAVQVREGEVAALVGAVVSVFPVKIVGQVAAEAVVIRDVRSGDIRTWSVAERGELVRLPAGTYEWSHRTGGTGTIQVPQQDVIEMVGK